MSRKVLDFARRNVWKQIHWTKKK